MSSTEILPCILYEKKIINYNNEKVIVYKFKDVILCLYNPVYDNYIHMSGLNVGTKTLKEYRENNSNFIIFPFEVTSVASISPSGYDIKKIFKEIKDNYENDPYRYLNKLEGILKINDKKLHDKVENAFGKKEKIKYFFLDDYNEQVSASITLKNNINKINKLFDASNRSEHIDYELDRYNSYIKKK